MKYMIRERYTCQRGKVPEYLESLKIVVGFTQAGGIEFHKILVDISGPMDTVYHEFEVDDIQQYFAFERGVYENPDVDTQKLIDHVNSITASAEREIFEVLM